MPHFERSFDADNAFYTLGRKAFGLVFDNFYKASTSESVPVQKITTLNDQSLEWNFRGNTILDIRVGGTNPSNSPVNPKDGRNAFADESGAFALTAFCGCFSGYRG